MIVYAVKKTKEYYEMTSPGDLSNPFFRTCATHVLEQESGNSLREWGAKHFVFDGRPCLLVMNFASKLTFVLINFRPDDIDSLADLIKAYMENLYDGDRKMLRCVERYFKEQTAVCFETLKDKSIIASLNSTLSYFLEDGYRLADYIKNGIMHSKDLNRDINRYPVTKKVNGKAEYILPGEEFRRLLTEHYSV